jgi:hypothetical protein
MTNLSTISQGATLAIEPDELLGLTALAELDKADGGKVGADAVTEARTLMRRALADKLEETGLPWAPSPEVVRQRAEAAEPEGTVLRLARSGKVRKVAAYGLAVAALVVLWGGYAHGWQWTGLRANGQLWDWLSLLLLPVVLGTIPLWMQDRKYISHRRRVLYGAAVVAWIAFVIAGYLVPLNWTGFRGQKLADWLQLLLIPAAVTVTMAMISRRGRLPQGRWLRLYHVGIAAALVTGWIITLIGGYRLGWTWTGYVAQPPHPQLGNLWDWLALLLPIVLPVLLLPPLVKWVTGDAAGRAEKAEEVIVAGTAAAAPGTSPRRRSAGHRPARQH